MNTYNIIKSSLLALGTGLMLSSCVKFQHDDAPEANLNFEPANAKIMSLDELYGYYPGDFDSVGRFLETENGDSVWKDIYLNVVVIGNDVSGNIYKSMYVRDKNCERALNLSVDKTGLYNFYPVGQELYINCSGLYIGKYENLPQLGFRYADDAGTVSLGRIPDAVFTRHVFKNGLPPTDSASLPQPIEITDASQLENPALYNQLVLLRNIEFSPDDINQEFAPAPPTGTNPTSTNRTFTINGTGSGLTLRTSSACRFFRRLVPAGIGDMVCIYAIYGETKQFYLRQFEDLNINHSNTIIFWQSFANGFGNFTAYDAKGSASWEIGTKGDKNYVQVSAYQSGKNEDWLYSPEIELPQAEEYDSLFLSFEQAIAYQTNPPAENYTIRISEDFSGTGDPRDATWNILKIPNPHPGASSGSFTFMNTGNINLRAYAGKKVRVAFVFDNSDGQEPTWEVRKLKIVANE